VRILILLALAAVVPGVYGQDVADCIEQCFNMSCSGYPLGSSSKDACRDRCTYNCKLPIKTWGAIAYSKTDKAYGYSYEMEDEQSARQVALTNCRKHGTNCVLETVFNRTCAAVAAGGDRVGWGTAPTRDAAEQRAMTECSRTGAKGCEVQTWVCSAPSASGGTVPAPTPPPAPKAVSWGAIAYSAGDMGAGWSQGKGDRASAEREALAACQQRGKACVLQPAFNKQCGALAADGRFQGFGASTDARQAQQKAMDDCRKAGGTRCVLHVMFCSN
jgi:hypothetical protein